jgi:hypothetical protein
MRNRPFPTEEDLASIDEEALKAKDEAERDKKDDDEEDEWLGEIQLSKSHYPVALIDEAQRTNYPQLFSLKIEHIMQFVVTPMMCKKSGVQMIRTFCELCRHFVRCRLERTKSVSSELNLAVKS